MRRSWNRRPRLRLSLLLVLAAVLAGGAVGWGAVPGTDGEIDACYDFEGKGMGKIRVIDDEIGESCKPTEQQLSWFSTGGSHNEFLDDDLLRREVSGPGIEIHTLNPCGPNEDCKLTAFCGQQYVELTGGFRNIDQGTHLQASEPWSGEGGWEVRWRNNSTVDTVTVTVNCSR